MEKQGLIRVLKKLIACDVQIDIDKETGMDKSGNIFVEKTNTLHQFNIWHAAKCLWSKITSLTAISNHGLNQLITIFGVATRQAKVTWKNSGKNGPAFSIIFVIYMSSQNIRYSNIVNTNKLRGSGYHLSLCST